MPLFDIQYSRVQIVDLEIEADNVKEAEKKMWALVPSFDLSSNDDESNDNGEVYCNGWTDLDEVD